MWKLDDFQLTSKSGRVETINLRARVCSCTIEIKIEQSNPPAQSIIGTVKWRYLTEAGSNWGKRNGTLKVEDPLRSWYTQKFEWLAY